MTPCLRPEEFIDALDGHAGRDGAAHVAACPQCHATLAEMRAALAAAESVDVPEPSPLFWSQLNARVGAAISDETRADAPASWWAWLRWDVVVPLAGVATVVVALGSGVGRAPGTQNASPVADAIIAVDDPSRAAADGDQDGALELMLDLAATMPGSEWDALGLSALPDLGEASQSLSADERRALSALLHAAVERPSS